MAKEERSQSLLLFRAFQQWTQEAFILMIVLSQSLLLFRAFQPSPSAIYQHIRKEQSQSLLLFRAFQRDEWDEVLEGIRQLSQSLLLFRAFQPSVVSPKWGSISVSQSLLLFRAFQLAKQVGVSKEDFKGRNPFFYSGHFNLYYLYSLIHIHFLSQSLLLFRAFQPAIYQYIRNKYLGSQSLLLFRAFQPSYLSLRERER